MCFVLLGFGWLLCARVYRRLRWRLLRSVRCVCCWVVGLFVGPVGGVPCRLYEHWDPLRRDRSFRSHTNAPHVTCHVRLVTQAREEDDEMRALINMHHISSYFQTKLKPSLPIYDIDRIYMISFNFQSYPTPPSTSPSCLHRMLSWIQHFPQHIPQVRVCPIPIQH